jgi:site-specific recombinase XerD
MSDKKTHDYLNNFYDYNLANDFNKLAGGQKEKCNILEKGRQENINEILPKSGVFLEELKSALKNINRVNTPIFLDPNNATWLDVACHGNARQNLKYSTIEKHLRTARFMENHVIPVDFRNLSVENVIKHFDYRISIEKATRDALRHERDAVYMFLRAYKQFTDEWREYLILPKKRGGLKIPFVLMPSQVNKLYHGTFGKTSYENVLFQTIIFTLVNFGMRPPSEIINLNLENIVINKDGTGYIWIVEDKKYGIERQYFPYDKKVLSSKVYRTPYNYINTWRDKVKTEKSGNALFLQPNGKRVTGKYIRDHIVNQGKEILQEKKFKLYTCRHTFATYYYDWTKDLKEVARRLGHSKTDSIDHYIGICKDIKKQIGQKNNLFDMALRQTKNKLEESLKRDCSPKKRLSRLCPPVARYGPDEILTRQQKGKIEIVKSFKHYLGFCINSLIIKPFSYFFTFFDLTLTGGYL